MLETEKVDNNNIREVLCINPLPLYVADMHYLEECSGSERLFIVQW